MIAKHAQLSSFRKSLSLSPPLFSQLRVVDGFARQVALRPDRRRPLLAPSADMEIMLQTEIRIIRRQRFDDAQPTAEE